MMVCGKKIDVKPRRPKPLIALMNAMFVLGVFVSPATAVSNALLPACPATPVASWNGCQGTHTYPDGGKYVGEYHDGAPNGQGILTYQYWGEYVGAFRNGRPDGEGAFTYPDGRKYNGHWRDGALHGRGVLLYPDGRAQSGEWREGQFTTPEEDSSTPITAALIAFAVTIGAALFAIARIRTLETPENEAATSDAEASSQQSLDAALRLLEEAVEDFSVSDRKMLELRENARRRFAAQRAARKGFLGFLKFW